MGEPKATPDRFAPLGPLPIFPLSTIVLLPRLQVPLYIFEARYRQMVEDALEGEARIGMVAVSGFFLIADTASNPSMPGMR